MSGESEQEELYGGLLFIGLLILLMCYISLGIFLEVKRIKLVHETMAGLVIAIAFAVT